MFPEIKWNVELFGYTKVVMAKTSKAAAIKTFGFYCECMKIAGCNDVCCVKKVKA